MSKSLQKHGNSAALISEKPVMQVLGITACHYACECRCWPRAYEGHDQRAAEEVWTDAEEAFGLMSWKPSSFSA
jgi:hypothetical protein